MFVGIAPPDHGHKCDFLAVSDAEFLQLLFEAHMESTHACAVGAHPSDMLT
jgi:hypothetical protein